MPKRTRVVSEHSSGHEEEPNTDTDDDLPSDIDDFGPSPGETNQGYSSSRHFRREEDGTTPNRRRLTLGSIVQMLFDSCGKAKVCPPSLQANVHNVQKFVTAVVLYAKEIPPQFWHYLLDSTAANSPNVVVDPGTFPKGFAFVGSNEDGTSEVEEGQLNFYRVLKLAKEAGFDSGTRRPSVEVASLQKYLKNANEKKGTFGKTLCGLLVKLFDCRFNKGLVPSKKLREVHLGNDSEILKGYAALRQQPGNAVWGKKLCLEEEFVDSYPYGLCEASTDAELEEEYETDVEGDADEIEIVHVQPRPQSVLKQLRGVSMSTKESIERAKEDLQVEVEKEASYTKLAAQSKERAESIRDKIAVLTRRLNQEETDTKVVSVLAEKLGYDEYVKSGSEVPTVYLAVREYWQSIVQPISWEDFWSDARTTLDAKFKTLPRDDSHCETAKVQQEVMELYPPIGTGTIVEMQQQFEANKSDGSFIETCNRGSTSEILEMNVQPFSDLLQVGEVGIVSSHGGIDQPDLDVFTNNNETKNDNPNSKLNGDETTPIGKPTGIKAALKSAVHQRREIRTEKLPTSIESGQQHQSPRPTTRREKRNEDLGSLRELKHKIAKFQ